MQTDILITNAKIIDTTGHHQENGSLAIRGRQIAAVGATCETKAKAKWRIDAAGAYLSPGFIDFHTHVYSFGSSVSVRADQMLPFGVTVAVDAGTSGCVNFPAFYQTDIVNSAVKIRAYLNVYSGGQLGDLFPEDFSPELYETERVRRIFAAYPHRLLGLKIRLSKGLVPDGDAGLDYLRKAIELAESIDVPVCVHTTNPPVPTEEIATLLRPGDVYCHCFHGKGETILDEQDKVKSAIREAQQRGVRFDVANGRSNFSFRVAAAAIADGFKPDIISTDQTLDKANRPPFTKNLPYVMSRYLDLGLNLADVIAGVTVNPAVLIPDLASKIGSLEPGRLADLCLFTLEPCELIHEDLFGETLAGTQMIVPQMVITEGEVVYSAPKFAL